MKLLKKLLAFFLALVMLLNTCVFTSFAESLNDVEITDVMMTVGANETMRNLTWFSNLDAAGEVRYAKAADMQGDHFPADYSLATAIAAPTELDGIYTYKATMRGLEENTSYVYCIAVGESVSKNYTFEVKTFDNDFSFAYVTDVQVVDEGFANDWIDTMEKLQTVEEFKNSSFIVSGGDQVNDSEEALYDYFINDALSSIAMAPSWGRLHDEGILYDQHYNFPNLSSTYGNEVTASDYFYTYNNVLFVHINTGSADYDAHTAFLENAIATNPDCTWKIVVMHFSFFTGGRHSADSRVTGFKDAMAGTFNKLGVDLVLSGHDHVYTRSRLMLDGSTISDDVTTNNAVTDPEGTLYICGTKGSYRNFYDVEPAPTDPEIARFEDSDRKSAVSFEVTDESLTLRAYFLDGEEPEEFDNFTLHKTDYQPAEMPESYSVTYIDELGKEFGDSTDISLYAKRTFTTATPDEPRMTVPVGSLDENFKIDWFWDYYQVGGDGTPVTELENGKEYVAYLRCEKLKMSRTLTIADTSNPSECIYMWDDAWELIHQYPGEAFTFILSQDITLTSTSPYQAKVPLDLTVDLNGKTLTAKSASYMIELPNGDSNGSGFAFVSSKENGALNAGSKSVFQFVTGKSSQVSVRFGSTDTYPITVTAGKINAGKSSFCKATFNLSIIGGTYNFSSTMFDVRHSGSDYNTYHISIQDARINMTSSTYGFVRQYESGKHAGADSTFNAENCVFTVKTAKDFFGSDVWMGTAAFTGCTFENVVFDASLHSNLKGIIIGDNCVFNNFGNTFKAEENTEDPEVTEPAETPDEPTVPTSINYNFALYDHPLFSELISGNGSKYSKYEKQIEAAYPDDQNWIVENQDPDITAANLTFFTDQGMRMTLGAGNWGALRLYVPNSARYDIVLTSIRQDGYTAKAWLIPAQQETMTAAEIEAAMVDSNALNHINSVAPDYSCNIGQRDFTAGEYILIFQADVERVYLGNIDLIEIPVENDTEEPSDTPVVVPGNTLERIPESDNILGFASSKMTLAEGCYIVSLDADAVATVGTNSIETTISANTTVVAGSTLTYTVECTNNIPNAVSAVITAKIPENTTFVSADNDGIAVGNGVSWNLQLPAGEKVTLSFHVSTGEAETFESYAVVTLDNVRFTSDVVTSVSVDKFVAQIGDESFGSLADAVMNASNGDVITLLDNVVAEDLVLSSGVNLDLNGYTLTADSVLTYSSSAIVDSSVKDTGVLKINDVDGNMISADNAQLPVFDAAADGYRFFNLAVISNAVTSGNKYWYRVDAENFDELYKLIQAGSQILFQVEMTWDGQEEPVLATADFAFTQRWAECYYADNGVYVTVTVTENEGVENFSMTADLIAGNV